MMRFSSTKQKKKYRRFINKEKEKWVRKIKRGEVSRQTLPFDTFSHYHRDALGNGGDLYSFTWLIDGIKISLVGKDGWFVYSPFEKGYKY